MKAVGFRTSSWGSSFYPTFSGSADVTLDVSFVRGAITDNEPNLKLEWHTGMHDGSKTFDMSAGTYFTIPDEVNELAIEKALEASYAHFEDELKSYKIQFAFNPKLLTPSIKTFTETDKELVKEKIEMYKEMVKKKEADAK